MVQVGGSAAINGFLYQLLNHLSWMAHAEFRGDGQDVPSTACIVLEPKDGGDARREGCGIYLVEQYKARPESTWPVRQIIEGVLPNLLLAVKVPPPTGAVYRFVTDGKPGRLRLFNQFLRAVREADSPDDLDHHETHAFARDAEQWHLSHRGLFDKILGITAGPSRRKDLQSEAAVWHLLRHFEMQFETGSDPIIHGIDRLLRKYCDDLGDERMVRQRLVGTLMERLSNGELRLNAADVAAIFKGVGLQPDRMQKLALLSETLGKFVNDALEANDYRAYVDVRSSPPWDCSASVLLIHGASGSGKTWQLAKLARSCVQRRDPVLWVTGIGSATDILNNAMRTIWQEALGATNTKEPSALTNHYKEMNPGAQMPWLTVAVDDVQDLEVARALVSHPWERWGMRLALTTTNAVAESLRPHLYNFLQLLEVDQFSLDEIDSLLGLHGHVWGDLPSDLQKLLRTPILAGLYLRLPYDSFSSAPNAEYEIFEAYWDRLPVRAAHGDDGILLAIAGACLKGDPYPIPRTNWQSCGLGERSLARLVSSGWLRCLPGGDVAFLHDRLLNWAVAVELVHRLRADRETPEEIGETLKACIYEFSQGNSRRLDYVPMDVLWLLSGDPTQTQSLLRIVQMLETSPNYGGYGKVFYDRLLPSLGGRALPVFIARLDAMDDAQAPMYKYRLIADGLAKLAEQKCVDLTTSVDRLLSCDGPGKNEVGLLLAQADPRPAWLDDIWKIHLRNSRAQDSHVRRETTVAALRATVPMNTDWLRELLVTGDGMVQSYRDLIYLLLTLELRPARHLWEELKHTIREKISPISARPFMQCIGRFRDRPMITVLHEYLGCQDDFVDIAAFSSLAQLDPDAALARLVELPQPRRCTTVSWWLPTLLACRRKQTQEMLLKLAKMEPDPVRELVFVYRDHQDDLDGATLNFILTEFELQLGQALPNIGGERPQWPARVLDFLCRINAPAFVARLRKEAGGMLEALVLKLACDRIADQIGYHDPLLHEARRFLIRLGGEGITILVNEELRASKYWPRHGGLKWASVRPNRETARSLARIAMRPLTLDANGQPDSKAEDEYYYALEALAVLGADQELVAAIWSADCFVVSSKLSALRGERPPMDTAITAGARGTLADESAPPERLRKALGIAWVSGDRTFVSAVMRVLERYPADSELAGLACITLHHLGDKSTDFASRTYDLLFAEKNRIFAANALFSMGEPGFAKLKLYLEHVPFTEWEELHADIVNGLSDEDSERDRTIQWAGELCKNSVTLRPLYGTAAESADPAVREKIVERAFYQGHCIADHAVDAIRALAKFDHVRALQALERRLKTSRDDARELCLLLAKLESKAAAERLVEYAHQKNANRSASAMGLRKLSAADVDPLLADMLADENSETRAIAAELAGWMPGKRLEKTLTGLVETEAEEDVRQAVFKALERKRRERMGKGLIRSIPNTPPHQCWAVCEAIVDLTDPYLLTDVNDELWIGKYTDKMEPVLHFYLQERIAKKMKDLESASARK